MSVAEKYKAKFDFDSTSSGVLSFKAGELFLLVSKTNEDWWTVRSSSKALGLVPANYIELQEEDQIDGGGPSITHKVAAAYVAIYDWTKQEDNQLSFKKGDKLFLIDKTDQSWWTMRDSGGEQSGLVPITYIDKFEQPEEAEEERTSREEQEPTAVGEEQLTASSERVVERPETGEKEMSAVEDQDVSLREVLKSIENAMQQIYEAASVQDGKYTQQQWSTLQSLVSHRQKVLAESRTNGTDNKTFTKLTHTVISSSKAPTGNPPRRQAPPPPTNTALPPTTTNTTLSQSFPSASLNAMMNSSSPKNSSRKHMHVEHVTGPDQRPRFASSSLPRSRPRQVAPGPPRKEPSPPRQDGSQGSVQVHSVRVTATSPVKVAQTYPSSASTFSPTGPGQTPRQLLFVQSHGSSRRHSADLENVPHRSSSMVSARRGSECSPTSPRKVYNSPQKSPTSRSPPKHGSPRSLRRNPSSSPTIQQKYYREGSPSSPRRQTSASHLPGVPQQQQLQGPPPARSRHEGSPPLRPRNGSLSDAYHPRVELPTQFPSDDGAELVEIVRSRTGMSYSKSLLAVAGMLEFMKNKVPVCTSMVDGLLDAVRQSQSKAVAPSSSKLQGSSDMDRIKEIFFEIQELKDDKQQRGWAVHDDQQAIMDLLEELLQILCDADPEVTRAMVQEDKYENILNVITYYQIESRVPIRLLMLKVFGVLCGLDQTIISVLLTSVLPNELGRDIRDNLTEIQKTLYSCTVCTMIFSTAEAIPLSVYDQWTVEYVLFLMDTVEDPPEEDEEEQVADAFLNVILSFNQHFQNPSGNTVMNALEQRPNPRNLSEKLMFLVNRGEDPVAITEPCCPDSLTKFLLDVFSSQSTSGMFYTTDMMVLIDIVSRQLHDLSAGEENRTHYLELLYRIVNTTNYREHKHRQKDLISCLNRIAQEEGEESLRDHDVIKKIWIDFPGIFEEYYEHIEQSLYCKDHLDTVRQPPDATLFPQQSQDGMSLLYSSLSSNSPLLNVQQGLRRVGPSQEIQNQICHAPQAMQHQAMPSQHQVIPPVQQTPPSWTESPSKDTQIQVENQVKLRPLISSIMPDALHPLPKSHTKFIDPVEVIHCDSSGGIYHNPLHGITLRIPAEAIPHGEHLEISIGVGLCGDFSFPNGLSPVSAILWLCSRTETTFLKPVEVTIPHFLDCKSKEDAESLELQFMKASHRNLASEATQFLPADGETDFTSVPNKGILHTHHFCHLCICANVSPEQLKSCKFYITCAIQRPITTGSVVYFYVLYFLDTCIQFVEKQLSEGYFIIEQKSLVFQFSDEAEITGEYHVQCLTAQRPVTLTLEHTHISQDMIDFWQLHKNRELELMEKRKLYPPSMQLTFGDLSSCEEQVVTVLFRGTQEPVEQMKIEFIVPDLSDNKGTSTPVQSRGRTMPALKDEIHMHQLLRLKTVPPVRIIETLAVRWKDLGFTIDFDHQGKHVRLIEKKCSIEGPVACCMEVFLDWLSGKGAYQPPTWKNLLEILKDMEENLEITLRKLLTTVADFPGIFEEVTDL